MPLKSLELFPLTWSWVIYLAPMTPDNWTYNLEENYIEPAESLVNNQQDCFRAFMTFKFLFMFTVSRDWNKEFLTIIIMLQQRGSSC